MGSFIPTNAYAVISDGRLMHVVEAWFTGIDLAEPLLLEPSNQDEDAIQRDLAYEANVRLILRVHYLLGRMQGVFFPPVGELRTPIQNQILEAQRQQLRKEWDALMKDLYFQVDNGLFFLVGDLLSFFENAKNRAVLEQATELQPLRLYQLELRLELVLERDGTFSLYLRRALESGAQDALQRDTDGFSPAVAIAENYRWARYCYDRLEALDGGVVNLIHPIPQRFAEQVAYWDAQAGEDAMWGGSNNENDSFFATDVLPAVTLDRVIEIRNIHTHYGEQTQIIVDDGELTQPHAHWGNLFDAALVRVRELTERGDMQRAEIYMLFALYLKTGEHEWFLLLKEHSNADAPGSEPITLPGIMEETAPLLAELLAIYLSNPEHELQGSIYSSMIFLYLANASGPELMSFLGQVGQHLSPAGNVSIRVGYARLIGECLGRGVFGLVSTSVRDSAYELLVLFIRNHLSVRGPFEGQASLASIAPLVRSMIQPSSELSPNQLGRLLSWVQRMLGVTGFKKLLRETYGYSEEQIQALVREVLITVGDIAEAMPELEQPHNEVVNSMFLLWGHFTDTYGEEAHDSMRRVVEHWSFKHMEQAFNSHCQKKMVKRAWASEYEGLQELGVIS